MKLKLFILILTITQLMGCAKDHLFTQPHAPIIEREKSDALTERYASQRSHQVSNVNYTLSFDLTGQGSTFSGISTIAFDLDSSIKSPVTIDYNAGVIHSLKVNGKQIEVNFDKWFIEVPLRHFSNGKNTVSIAFTTEYAKNGSGLHKFIDPEDGEIYLYSDFEPYDANKMFPHFDQPNLKATYELTVKAPKSWQVISNVMEDSVKAGSVNESSVKENSTNESSAKINESTKTWHFPRATRYSSYILALHAGPYHQWSDATKEVPLRLFARKTLAKYVKPDDWFPVTQKSFEFFNQYFDIPYPYIKYDQIIVPDFNSGAMENIGAVTFNESYVKRGVKSIASRRGHANTIAHELAHMWFGNLVTMDWWDGLWLNESFATFMANLALSETQQFDNIWETYYTNTKQWAYSADDSITTHAIQQGVINTTEAFSNFDGITYGKGGSVLKQLRFYVGEENFRRGVSDYLKKHSYKNTRLSDFITAIEDASNMNLVEWTQQWLYEEGLNTIETQYQCINEKISSFNIIQKAPKYNKILRTQKVIVGLFLIEDDAIQLNHEQSVVYSGKKTEIKEFLGMRCPDLVYPNLRDYGYVKVLLDSRSRGALFKHINSINDDYARLMLWQSIIDSTNDAQLPIDKFVDFVIENIPHEKNITIIDNVASGLANITDELQVASQVKTSALTYIKTVEDFMWQMLKQSKAHSEEQKIWYRHYVSNVINPTHLKRLLDILDGKLTLPGIEVDQDKRWSIVLKMNQYGYGNYETLLSKEQQRDKSDKGRLKTISAEVIRPIAEIKKKWFSKVNNTKDDSKLVEKQYAMYSLFPRSQFELQRPYLATILETIPKLNEMDDDRFLQTYVYAFIPTNCNQESVDALSSYVEKFKHLKFPVTKALKIMHEDDERCLERVNLFLDQ